MKLIEETKKVFKDTWQHFFTGNSYMLPMLMVGCIAMQIVVLVNPGDSAFWNVFEEMAEIGMTYFVPIMAAFTAYSVADNPGLVPGFICGILAQRNDMGYLGAFLGGLLAGYFTYILSTTEVHEKISSIWGSIIPVISTIITALIIVFVLAPPCNFINTKAVDIMLNLGKLGGSIMGAIIGLLGGLDYGGMISKIQSTFSTIAISESIFTPLGICGAAVTVPPLGMCLAIYLAPKLYNEEQREYAKDNWVTAIIAGFTEVVIPFAMEEPKIVTVATVIGSMVTGIIAGAMELKLYVPILGIPQWFFYDKPLVFAFSAITGIVTVAIIANFLKARELKKKIK